MRLERLRDNSSCLNGSVTSTDYVPNVLYDTREGVLRDGTNDSAPVQFGGIMHYVSSTRTTCVGGWPARSA